MFFSKGLYLPRVKWSQISTSRFFSYSPARAPHEAPSCPSLGLVGPSRAPTDIIEFVSVCLSAGFVLVMIMKVGGDLAD